MIKEDYAENVFKDRDFGSLRVEEVDSGVITGQRFWSLSEDKRSSVGRIVSCLWNQIIRPTDLDHIVRYCLLSQNRRDRINHFIDVTDQHDQGKVRPIS